MTPALHELAEFLDIDLRSMNQTDQVDHVATVALMNIRETMKIQAINTSIITGHYSALKLDNEMLVRHIERMNQTLAMKYPSDDCEWSGDYLKLVRRLAADSQQFMQVRNNCTQLLTKGQSDPDFTHRIQEVNIKVAHHQVIDPTDPEGMKTKNLCDDCLIRHERLKAEPSTTETVRRG